MKQVYYSISPVSKMGLGYCYFYVILLFIGFVSKSASINSLIESNAINVYFPENYQNVLGFLTSTIFGELGYEAILGIILIICVFIITQLFNKSRNSLSLKSFLYDCFLFCLALIFPCILLRGNGFINYT